MRLRHSDDIYFQNMPCPSLFVLFSWPVPCLHQSSLCQKTSSLFVCLWLFKIFFASYINQKNMKKNECPICSVSENTFYKNPCCNQEICEECWQKIDPQICPFCRTDLTNWLSELFPNTKAKVPSKENDSFPFISLQYQSVKVPFVFSAKEEKPVMRFSAAPWCANSYQLFRRRRNNVGKSFGWYCNKMLFLLEHFGSLKSVCRSDIVSK